MLLHLPGFCIATKRCLSSELSSVSTDLQGYACLQGDDYRPGDSHLSGDVEYVECLSLAERDRHSTSCEEVMGLASISLEGMPPPRRQTKPPRGEHLQGDNPKGTDVATSLWWLSSQERMHLSSGRQSLPRGRISPRR